MSFWLNGPVEINDPSKSQDIQILYDYNTMLKYIQQIFQKSKIKLSFTVYNNSLSKEKKIDILDFINNNYLGNEYFTVKYSYDLFNHYLHNSIIIECHPIDQLDKTIGIVVGKRKKLCYNKTIGTMDTMDTIQTIDTLEVDFLCLTKQLRNSSNKITSHLSRVLCKHIDLFYKKKYTLFDIHTEQDMYSILNNKSFHNFIFYDERDNVSDYICFFQLDCHANDTSGSFKSGFLYTYFYKDINLLQDKLNFIYLKMANENILDMITINNFKILYV